MPYTSARPYDQTIEDILFDPCYTSHFAGALKGCGVLTVKSESGLKYSQERAAKLIWVFELRILMEVRKASKNRRRYEIKKG